MKLHNSIGPNPQVVRVFAAEKNITLPLVEVDLMGGENRAGTYKSNVNPAGQLPALELNNGDVITEITAICEYLDEVSDGPSLIGETAEERAQTRRWVRFVDLNIMEPMANGFRFSEGMPLFESRMRTIPEAADGLKACAQDKLTLLNEQMAGRDYVAGDKFTLADILLYCFLTFGESVGQALNPDNANIKAWYDRMKERPSFAA